MAKKKKTNEQKKKKTENSLNLWQIASLLYCSVECKKGFLQKEKSCDLLLRKLKQTLATLK